jgi:integrase/recombinase XerC
MRKFAAWFTTANKEPFQAGRVTIRDVTDFKDHLRREMGQAVATVNRALVTLRRYFGWLAEQGHVPANPARQVKQLRRVQLAPKGLDRAVVRRLLREAMWSATLWTGMKPITLKGVKLMGSRSWVGRS